MNLERDLKRYVRSVRPGLIGATASPDINLTQLISEMKAQPQVTAEIGQALEDFLCTREFTTALTETGLTLEAGLFTEIVRRLEYKVLPKSADSVDILSFLNRIFDGHSDSAWLEEVDPNLLKDFFQLLLPNHQKLIEALIPQFFMSLEILTLRLAGLGYEPLVTQKLKNRPELQHAFMDVTRKVHILLEKGEEALPAMNEALDRCEQSVLFIRSRRRVDGVSLALTYRLLKIQQVVQRIRLLIQLLQSMLGTWNGDPAVTLFREIILAELRRFELRPFLVSNVELLAFQITEHTGRAGEHYITRTRNEWLAMGRSAALGGAMVAVIAIMKVLAARLHLPPGPEAFLFGLIYASGFIAVHQAGGTLATKQPAMTASTLAAALDEAGASQTNMDATMEGVAEVIVRTVRSQLIALLGNYVVAFPTAVLISLPFAYMHIPIMPEEKALATLESLHGFQSLSFFYAALAGVCLFLSGLIAGFADNWFVFNHVGSRLRQSELLRRLVGWQNLDSTIYKIDHNIGFWVGNISLGFFLGAMPDLGLIFGLPLDIRHITFASAQFGVALTSLNFVAPIPILVTIAGSILVMGLVNLAVSFSLTLFVVVKSRKVRFAQTPLLLRKLGERLRRQPLQFILPVGDDA